VFVDGILAAGLGLLALAGVAGLAGGVSPTLDLLNHLTPFYLLGSLGLVVRALMAGRWRWPLLALGTVGTVCAAILFEPEMAAIASTPHAAPAAGAPTVTILTQNVWEHNPDPAQTAAAIERTGADIVMLQEAKGAGRGVVPLLAAGYPYHADCTWMVEWCSMAILSKRPILTWSHHEGAWAPPDWDRASYVRATIDGGPAGPFEVIDTQLMHPAPDPDGKAALQVRQFLAAIGAADLPRTILAGDLNRPAWSFALKRIDAQVAMIRRTHGLATWPCRLPIAGGRIRWPAPFLPIDQIYAGSAWKTVSIKRGPVTGSDHYGVLATLVYQP
jgi:endonuclease/exonuclease/phosphatase (EEP) superfamily protein YafD